MEWKQVPDPEKPDEQTWMASRPRKDSDGDDLYFFKGEKAPTYNGAKQEWQVDENSGGIYMQERVKSKEYMAIQEGPDANAYNVNTKTPLDKDFDWDAAIANIEKDLSGADTSPTEEKSAKGLFVIEKEVEHKKELGDVIDVGPDLMCRYSQEGESLLAQCLRTALTQHPGPGRANTLDKMPVSKMTVCTINSQRFCGYLVCVTSDNTHQREFMTEIIPTLANELKLSGEPLLGPLQILDIEVSTSVPFGPWAETKANFTINSKRSGMSLAFFQTPGQPQVIEAKDDSVLGISLERDLLGDTQLNFGLYLHLPKNDKYLLYLNKGQNFTKNMLRKFVAFGVKVAYIRKVEKEAFLAYCAKNFIASTLK
jgi:hypothetical protein